MSTDDRSKVIWCCIPVKMAVIRTKQGRRKQFTVGAVMVCAQSAREIFYVTLIIHEQSRTYYGV